MGAGMDSAIMNPSNRDTMATLLAAEMLLGRMNCRNFMAFRKGKSVPKRDNSKQLKNKLKQGCDGFINREQPFIS